MAENARHGLHGRLVERFGGRMGEAVYTFFAGVVVLTVVGWLLNRAAGVPVPVLGTKETPGTSR